MRVCLRPRIAALLIGLAGVALLAAACGGGSGSQPAPTATTAAGSTPVPQVGGTLRVAVTGNSKTLDPALGIAQPDIWVGGQVYDKLVELGLDMSVQPELATSWQPSPDLLSYTFNLRQGVKFHSGEDFTSEDVVFTIKRLLDPNVGSPVLPVLSSIKDITAINDHAVRIDLKIPSAFLPELLTAYQVKIIDSKVDPKTLATKADGTGPFTLQEFKAGERAVLKRNPNYWGDGPYVNEVVFFYIPGNQARYEALKTGSVDVVFPLATSAVADLEKAPGVKVARVPSAYYMNLVMDTQQAPFNNKKVRQAIQAATDREAINKVAILGLGTVGADIAILPTDPSFPPGVKPAPYDPQRAKQLLQEAGYPEGIDITLHTSDVWPGMVEMAVAFKESAAPAGIRVSISREPEQTWEAKVWLQVPFFTSSWNGRDPDSALSINALTGSPWNESNLHSPEIDGLIVKARGQTDIKARQEIYRQLQAILADEAARIITVFVPVFMGLRDNVEGLSPYPSNLLLLEGARLK